VKRPAKRKVLIIYTGGTFGMEPGSRSLKTPDLSPAKLKARLRERVPELAGIAQCDVEIALNCDSAHIGPAEWLSLASLIRSRWRKYAGVVLLHGTDTMAYTASALSFLLRPCLKPVVLTGAQKPLSALRTDARRNLISAVEIAAFGPKSVASRVSIFFDDRLFQGNRARKRSASKFAAFESPQAPPLAVVGTGIQYAPQGTAKNSPGRFKGEFNPRVALLHVTPGFPAELIRKGLLDRLDGLVLVVFQSGTAPTQDEEFIALLRAARAARKPVILVTEGEGATDPKAYAAGGKLLAEGAYWAGAMTPECAYVKACWLLAQEDAAAGFAARWKRQYSNEG
jgi:L-asparaginase